MESILQFMYLGEGKFYHERMREFIKVAQDLEVKEISDGVELPSEEAVENVEENIPQEEIEEISTEEIPSQPEQTKVRPRRPRTQISNDNKSTQCPECGAQYVGRRAMLVHHMKVSGILVISVIIRLHNVVVFGLTSRPDMKLSSNCVISVIIKPHSGVLF